MSKILEKVVSSIVLLPAKKIISMKNFSQVSGPIIAQGCISLLVLLDLSATFDTIDHDILINRMQNYTGIQGQALRWFRS